VDAVDPPRPTTARAIQLTREWAQTLPGLVELDTEPCPLRAEVWLVTHRGIREVPRIRAVWTFLADLFGGMFPITRT
jgi:hypothetical protein